MPPKSDTWIEVLDLCKDHVNGAVRTPVLRGVSFSIARGELVALMGASGSGKSTLLQLIGSLDGATSGSIRVGGVDVSKLSDSERSRFRRRGLGFVFQSFNLLPTLTALENVLLPLVLEGRAGAEEQKKALALLERLGLGHRVDQPASRLSGGESQRVAIARALILEPALILADEPTGALDSVSGRQVLKLLVELCRERGQTVLLATHDSSIAAAADRVIRLADGRMGDGSRDASGSDGDRQAPPPSIPRGTPPRPLGAAGGKLGLLTLKPLLAQPFRTLAVLCGLVVAGAFCTSVKLLGDAVVTHHEERFKAKAADASLIVSGGTLGFGDDVVDKIERTPGVAGVLPAFEQRTELLSAQGREPLVVFGFDVLSSEARARLRAARPGNKKDGSVIPDPIELLSRVDHALVPASWGAKHGLARGSRLRVMTSRGPRELRYYENLPESRLTRSYGEAVAVMDIDSARAFFGRAAHYDWAAVRVKDGLHEKVLEDLRRQLGPAFEIELPDAAVASAGRQFEMLRKLLALLGKVALATSGLLVLNFLTLSLHARLRQLAVLRALGATRAQVFGGVLGECALVGALGSGAGVALGAFVANAMAAWASASFSTQFHEPVTLTRVAPEPLTLAGCFALTFVTALLAGVWPAFRAARVTPVALFRAGAGSGDPIRPPRTGRPLLDYVLQAGFRQPSRSFLGIACMVVSLTAVVTVSLLNSSFKETLRARMEYGFLPDVVLIPKGSSRVDQRQPFHESLVKELERLPGVKGAYGQRIVPWTYRGRKVSIRSFDDPGAEHGYRMLEVIDRPTAEAGRELYTSSDATVVVSQAFTRTFDQRTGDRLELDTPSGHVSARVVGVINDSTSPVGAIYLSHPRYRELWRDPLLSGIGVMVRDAAQGEAVRREIVARLGDSRNLLALSKDEWVSNVFGVIDSAFAYASILELVTLFIAAFGLFNCVFLNVLDRSREFALLRALGGSRVQIFKLVLGETALYCAVATLLSGLLGASLVYACTMGPLQPLIGWMIRFSWSGAALARCLGAMGLATVLASALPGHRAANVEPALAMRCD